MSPGLQNILVGTSTFPPALKEDGSMKSQHCGLIVSVVLVKDDVESSSPMCAFLREQALSVSKFHTRNHKREGVVGMT